MASDALLVDLQQQRVAVAIDQETLQSLDLARALALAPQAPARARPIADTAGAQGLGHCLGIHPGHHQYLAGIVLLGDGGDQAGPVELDGVQDRRGIDAHENAPAQKNSRWDRSSPPVKGSPDAANCTKV